MDIQTTSIGMENKLIGIKGKTKRRTRKPIICMIHRRSQHVGIDRLTGTTGDWRDL